MLFVADLVIAVMVCLFLSVLSCEAGMQADSRQFHPAVKTVCWFLSWLFLIIGTAITYFYQFT